MTPRLFGASIDILDNLLAVGTPSIGKQGQILFYNIFERNIIDLDSNISAENGHIDDGFGISLKMCKKSPTEIRLIVGAHRLSDQLVCRGSAYVYTTLNQGKNWQLLDELVPPINIHKSFFGCAVDINNDIIIVGAYADNTEAFRSGSCSIYKINSDNKYQCIKTLYPGSFPNINQPQNMNNLYFGFSVCIYNSFIAIGAPSEISNGFVYLFKSDNDNWNNVTAHALTGSNRFGFSVKMKENDLIIGCPGKNGDSGTSYIYDISTIFDIGLGFISNTKENIHFKTIKTKSKSSKSLFGRSVAIYDNFYLISGFGKSDNEHIGSAFLYLKNKEQNNDTDEIYESPIACLRDKDAAELFGHTITLNDKFVVIADPTQDKIFIYTINNCLNGDHRRWHNAAFVIEKPEEFKLEIH